MSQYWTEPQDYPEFTESHAEIHAERIADLLEDRDWQETRDAVMRAWHNGEDRLALPVPEHLQPENWEVPADEPHFEAMHAAGL